MLLAYIFLIGPEAFHQLARADMAYSDLCTTDWANGGRTVYYQYDANGSMTQKLPAESGRFAYSGALRSGIRRKTFNDRLKLTEK